MYSCVVSLFEIINIYTNLKNDQLMVWLVDY